MTCCGGHSSTCSELFDVPPRSSRQVELARDPCRRFEQKTTNRGSSAGPAEKEMNRRIPKGRVDACRLSSLGS
jgi:hypothetical protein